VYSVSSQDVDQFFWLFPTGWQIIGNADNDTVLVKVGRNAGNISVTGTNACGFSSPINVGVGPGLLPVVSFITGDQTPCESEVKMYTVNSQEIDDYIWVFPDANWEVIGNDNTDAIMVRVGEAAGTISVIGMNQCGVAGPAELEVTPKLRPRNTGITGDGSPCQGETVEYIAQTLYADTVIWTFPANWTILDVSDVNIVAVEVGSDAGFVSAVGINECGESATQDLVVISQFVPEVFIGIIPELDDLTAVTTGEAVSYQWYLNGQPIAGANGQVYIPTVTGDYYVEVTFINGCVGASPVYTVIEVAIEPVLDDESIRLMPSPATDYIHVQGLDKETQAEILNIHGRLEMQTHVYENPVDITSLSSGIYVVKFHAEKGIIVKRFVIAR
jgi:hypothetical protein